MSNGLKQQWGIGQAAVEKARQAEREARVELARESAEYFCQRYLPHYFQHPDTGAPTGIDDWQQEVIDKAQDEERLAFAAPRGHGKTTLLSFALTLRDLLLGNSRFTIYIGPTFASACDRIEEIRMELEENEMILEDFGDLLNVEHKEGERRRRVGSQKQDNLNLTNGARIVAKGAGQSLRGIKKRQDRPDRVILDDVDRDDEVASRERMDKRIRWFRRVVMGLQGAGGMRILVVGNIIARNTLLTWCLDQEGFVSRVYRAIREDGTPLMPALWTLAKLERVRDTIGTDAFQTEYMNNPPAEGTRPFREAWLQKRWAREELLGAGPIITAADPSAGKSDRSDFQGIVSIRRHPDGRIFILKADIARRTRKGFAERIFSYAEAIGLHETAALVFESNGFQEWVAEEIAEAGAGRGLDLPMVQQTHTVNKFDRIAKLSPIAEGGRLLFPPEEEEDESIKLLRAQLEEFPDGRHDDGPDALAMAVEESAARIRDRGARDLPVGLHDLRSNPYGQDWRRDVRRELADRRRR